MRSQLVICSLSTEQARIMHGGGNLYASPSLQIRSFLKENSVLEWTCNTENHSVWRVEESSEITQSISRTPTNEPLQTSEQPGPNAHTLRDVPAIPILPQNTQWLLSWQLPPLGFVLSLKIYGKPQIPSPLGSPQPISRWHSWPGPGITDHGLSPSSLTMLSRIPVQASIVKT